MKANLLLSWIALSSVCLGPPALAGEWRLDKVEEKPFTALCAANSPQLKRWALKAFDYKEFEKTHLDGLLKDGWSLLESKPTTPLPLQGELVISIVYEDWRPWPTKLVKKSVDVKGNQVHLVFERKRYQYDENEKRPKVRVHQVVVAEDFTVAGLSAGEHDVFLNSKPIGKLILTRP